MTIAPPATIGMLGGGQLGRYAIVAAGTMGYGTVVLDPDASAPAGRVADEHLVAAFDDPAALDELATRCAVVTSEFENPPAAALERLALGTSVAPQPSAVAIAQDRIVEKQFLADQGVPIAPYVAVVEPADLSAAAAAVGTPAVLKTARLGYDGKGQHDVRAAADLAAAWHALGDVPCVLERRVPLDAEVSVVLGRASDGKSVVYPVAENHHRDGILDLTVVPARVPGSTTMEAQRLATRIADALAYVGVLAVELFVSGGRLLVNELAPRPHNSGHWTLDAARTSQFAQQIRAITGAALGDPSMTASAVAMVNLLGDLWLRDGADPVEPDWSATLADPNARLHLYGKRQPRPGRKMGHVTVVGETTEEVASRAMALRATMTRASPGCGR